VPSASVDVRRDRDAWRRSCVVERFTFWLNVVLARVRVPSASVTFVVTATRGGDHESSSGSRAS
jgi:hypothetical protein